MFALFFAKIPVSFFAEATCTHKFFFFPNWWEYLTTQPSPPDCSITLNFPSDIWLIGLAVIDILLRLAGLVAIVSIIAAGVGYITSSGNPENAAKARRRIYNSLIGLAIVFIAAGLVAFLGNTLGG